MLQTMSDYTCTRCGTQCVVMSTTAEHPMLCCDGDKPVVHKLGKIKIEKKAERIVAPSPLPEAKPNLPEAPKVMNPSEQPVNIQIKKAISTK